MLADKYMKIGMVLTACQIFERLGMNEEVVECLANGGQKERAKELALKLNETDSTPKLLCIMGDLF